MKRKLALVMAAAVIAGTVPAMPAHAATKTSVASVENATKDGSVTAEFIIEEDGGNKFAGNDTTSPGVFRISLGNDADFTGAPAVTATYGAGNTTVAVPTTKVSDSVYEITLTPATFGGNLTSITKMNVRGTVQFDGAAAGEQKAVIENINNTGITRKEVAYAVVSDGTNGVAKVLQSKKTVTRTSTSQAGAPVEIREITKNGFKNGKVELKLPFGFEWDTTNTRVNLNGVAVAAPSTITPADDNRTLVVDVQAGLNASVIDYMTVEPMIKVTKDGRVGDVDINVNDKGLDCGSFSSLVIAEYKSEGVTVKVDKVKEILAGQSEEGSDFEVKVTLEGVDKDSFTGRPIDVTVENGELHAKALPTGVTVTDKLNADEATKVEDNGSVPTGVAANRPVYDDEFSVEINKGTGAGQTTAKKFEITFNVRAGYDKGGKEIAIKVKGGGVDEQKVVIAKAIAPVTIETKKGDGKLSDVRVGVQNQEAPELVITESKAGALKKGIYVIDLNKQNANGVEFNDKDAKFEITEGDLQMEDPDVSKSRGQFIFEVKSESRKASKITIKGVKVDIDRTVPEGKLNARFARQVKDTTENGKINAFKEITTVPYLNVVTAAPGANKTTTVFTLDSDKFTVMENGVAVEKAMDAAPAVVDGRALLPIRYVANAVGVKDDAILWDATTRTATFFKGDRVVKMTLGSKTLIVNGTPVEMEVAPVVKNGRAMVPVRALANAFGVNLNWDDAARTITVEY